MVPADLLADPVRLALGALATLLLVLLVASRSALASARRALAAGERELIRAAEMARHLDSRLAEAATGRARLEDRHDRLQDAHGALQRAHAALRADSDGRLQSAEREIHRLVALREEMSNTFRQLATDTLTTQTARFGESNRERMEALLTPMREQVEQFRQELTRTQKGASEERTRLEERIRQLSDRSAEISREAVALTRALKGNKQAQGAWGEMILQSVLETSGLRRGREFDTQVAVTGEEGRRLRPDAIVRLPGGRTVVIDSKVSLVAYEAAMNAADEVERATHLRAHTLAVLRHVTDLAERDYSGAVEGAVDYTLMFLPVEPALAMALEGQPDLAARAGARRVFMVSPTTLMLALRTIEHVWTVDTRERNAGVIADRAGRLYDKVAGFCDTMEKVGRHIDGAREAHAAAFDQLSRGRGNVLSQVETLRELGARTGKTISVDFDSGAEACPRAVPEA